MGAVSLPESQLIHPVQLGHEGLEEVMRRGQGGTRVTDLGDIWAPPRDLNSNHKEEASGRSRQSSEFKEGDFCGQSEG